MSKFNNSDAGFTLLEIVCVLAIFGMTAAVLLPLLSSETSRSRLEAYAIEAATLLKSDRTWAIKHHEKVVTQIDAAARVLRSGSTGQIMHIPDDVVIDTTLPRSCEQRPVFSTINFFATGMSCGGVIAFTRSGSGFEIRVNWLTGNIEIVSRTNP